VLVVTAGVVLVCNKPKRIDSVKTTVNKIFRKESFKIFPNPIQSGSLLKVQIRKAGAYSIQLLDNNARLILAKDFATETDKI
jgi:hypothetical protein